MYKGPETRPKIVDTLNDFSEFFRFDEHAHFVSMIVHCGVIWDKGNISLPTVASCALDPRRHSADAELKSAIDVLKWNADGLLKIRHEAIAHRSKQFDYDEAFRRAQLTPDQIRDLLEDSLHLVNKLRLREGLGNQVFAELPVQNLMRLIHCLGGPDLRPKNWLDDVLEP